MGAFCAVSPNPAALRNDQLFYRAMLDTRDLQQRTITLEERIGQLFYNEPVVAWWWCVLSILASRKNGALTPFF